MQKIFNAKTQNPKDGKFWIYSRTLAGRLLVSSVPNPQLSYIRLAALRLRGFALPLNCIVAALREGWGEGNLVANLREIAPLRWALKALVGLVFRYSHFGFVSDLELRASDLAPSPAHSTL